MKKTAPVSSRILQSKWMDKDLEKHRMRVERI
jgi:hypothetical protein